MCLLFYTYSKRKFVSNKIGNFLENDFWTPALRSPPPPINFVHDFISIFKVFLQSYGRSAWPPSLSQLRGGAGVQNLFSRKDPQIRRKNLVNTNFNFRNMPNDRSFYASYYGDNSHRRRMYQTDLTCKHCIRAFRYLTFKRYYLAVYLIY